MNKYDDGFTLIDTIITLFIMSLSLLSIYGLLTKCINLEKKLISTVDDVIVAGEEYDEILKTFTE